MVLGDVNQGLALLKSDFFIQAFEEMGLMKWKNYWLWS